MENKYQTLLNILDCLRRDAPTEFKKYHPLETDIEKINAARARTFVHLYLKVIFGLLDFRDREHYITDGTHDGGVDAYYIDTESRKVMFIQSKFRTNGNNFVEKDISISELLKMDVERITEGESHDDEGNEYNGKIKQLQREISSIPDIGRYKYEIVLLANLKEFKPIQLKKLLEFPVEVFDFNRTYNELVFPVVSGTYYNESELCIRLNLANTSSSNVRASYSVETEFKKCDISMVYVPTLEIAKILYKYKNSILKYNPRSYLELANNDVNRDIAQSIVGRSTNEFALFNNGITILSNGTSFNEKVGIKDEAQVIVLNPQIINGGQTAYTLSRIYQQVLTNKHDISVFNSKEVLVKIITFDSSISDNDDARLKLVEEISKATNSQTPVNEADRRSNDEIQIKIQDDIFTLFGYYYERKRGEFSDGIKDGYIHRNQIIDRELFLRICMACDFRTAKARSSSMKQLFSEDNFAKTLHDSARVIEYFYGFKCWQRLNAIERKFDKDKNNMYGTINYGQGLRYGKFAVVAACNYLSESKCLKTLENDIDYVLGKWIEFESYAASQSVNSNYFWEYIDQETNEKFQERNYNGYYKGRTVDRDLNAFFGKPNLEFI